MDTDIQTQPKDKTEETTKKVVEICTKQLVTSTTFKNPWMQEIRKFENAYYGREKETFRVQFKVPLPVLSGMVDELKDAYDRELELRFGEGHPADYIKVKKHQAVWDKEVASLRPNARWNYKIRADKFLAILSGRGIQKTFAESYDGKFRLNFDVIDYRYFHCQPKGGGLLGNHLFKGEEGIFRTRSQIVKGVKNGFYSRPAAKIILMGGRDNEHQEENQNIYADKLSRFEAMGLDADTNNYVGEELYNLCEWYPTCLGKQWYVLFDPLTMQALRCEPMREVFESGLDPYTSWATHEDPKVFWGKSYAKDFYIAHDSIRTLLSQELTNRQKKNMTPTYFDPEVVDAARVDDAQYRYDAVVPVKTFGGVRQISQSLYKFDVPELGSATIDLSNWLVQQFRTLTGTQDISEQANGKVAANVVYSKLQSADKRLSHRSKSFQEAYAEVGLRAYHGIKENLTEPIAIKLIGAEGVSWDFFTREDTKLLESPDPTIVDLSEEDELNIIGKDQKQKSLDRIAANETLMQQVNPKKFIELDMADAGGWKKDVIDELLDTNAFESMKTKSKADIAILQLTRGKMADLAYEADYAFGIRISDFEREHRGQLAKRLEVVPDGPDAGRIKIFVDYLNQHMIFIAQNMGQLAANMAAQRKILNSQNQDQNKPAPGQPGQGASSPPAPGGPGPSINAGAPQVKMAPMMAGGGQGNAPGQPTSPIG
jgi:hypothetical protein